MGRRASMCCVALMVGATFGLTGCGGRGVVAAERLAQSLGHEVVAADHALSESAVVSKLDDMFSRMGNLDEDQQKAVLKASCRAKDMYDLSQAKSYNDAVKWVAGQSKVPAQKAKAFLYDLKELQEKPTLTGSGMLTASALCNAA